MVKRKAAESWVLSTCQASGSWAFACCWLQQCPAPCHGLASSPTFTPLCQVLLGTSDLCCWLQAWCTCSRPWPSLLPSALHPLPLGSAQGEACSCPSSPAPVIVTGDAHPLMGTPASSPGCRNFLPPPLQSCFICCHLPATTSHRLRTVSLLSWTISSYLLSVPCTHTPLDLLENFAFWFLLSLELELFRVWLSSLPSFLRYLQSISSDLSTYLLCKIWSVRHNSEKATWPYLPLASRAQFLRAPGLWTRVAHRTASEATTCASLSPVSPMACYEMPAFVLVVILDPHSTSP